MTRDDILMWYRNAKTADKLKAKLAEDDPVEYSDAEEQYSEIVAGIKAGLREQPRRLRAGLILQVLLAAG